ncbi:MAG: hypothetical protein ACK56F_27485, partial [bacterium]
MNQAGEPPAAAAVQTAPVADTPAGTAGIAAAAAVPASAAAAGDNPAAGPSGGFFSTAAGSGSNTATATAQAGCNSGSGTVNTKLSGFSFCPTPETVKKIFSKKVIPAEADATPSDAYTKIIKNKMQKGCPAAIGGIGHDQDSYQDCGSFYNSGDNRIKRGVYREDAANLCITSL